MMTLQHACELLGGAATLVGDGGVRVQRVHSDTRSLQPGDLFVALTDQRDGHDFVEAAFKAGAAGALVSKPVGGGPVVQVDDVLEALTALGIAARIRCGATCSCGTSSPAPRARSSSPRCAHAPRALWR